MVITKAQFSMLMRLAEYGEVAVYGGKLVTAQALVAKGLVHLDMGRAKLTTAGRGWLRERGAL